MNQFPTHNIRPLVYFYRQVTVGVNPAFKRRSDHRFRGGSHHQRRFQRRRGNEFSVTRFQTVMRHDRHLLGEAFDVRRFFLNKLDGNEDRKIAIIVSSSFDIVIKASPQTWRRHLASAAA